MIIHMRMGNALGFPKWKDGLAIEDVDSNRVRDKERKGLVKTERANEH